MYSITFHLFLASFLTIGSAIPTNGIPKPAMACSQERLKVWNREWCAVQQALYAALWDPNPKGDLLNSAIAAYYHAFVDQDWPDKSHWITWVTQTMKLSNIATQPSCDNSIPQCKTDNPVQVQPGGGRYVTFALCDAWFDDTKFLPGAADPTPTHGHSSIPPPTPTGDAKDDYTCKTDLAPHVCDNKNSLADFFDAKKPLKMTALLKTLLSVNWVHLTGSEYNPSTDRALTIPDALDYARGKYQNAQHCHNALHFFPSSSNSNNDACPKSEAKNNMPNVLYYTEGVYWSKVCDRIVPPDAVCAANAKAVTDQTPHNYWKGICNQSCSVTCRPAKDEYYCVCPRKGDKWPN